MIFRCKFFGTQNLLSSLPTRSLRFLRAAVDFTSSTLWLSYAPTASNRRRIVEIGKLLATVGWKFGGQPDCQPFSCRSSQNVTHCRTEICSTCLFKESIPAIPCGNSMHSLPTRSLSFLRAGVCSISSALWLHHAHPQ